MLRSLLSLSAAAALSVAFVSGAQAQMTDAVKAELADRLTVFAERTAESRVSCVDSLEGWTLESMPLACSEYAGYAKLYFATVEGALSGWGYLDDTVETMVGQTEAELTAAYEAAKRDYDAIASEYGIYRGIIASGLPPYS
ncbi:MAG: hypothetical protein NXI16_12445 [Alphaproteobacteria bacterium]|nr:hypothetical protein [Alphaproteobacteria bacterium]